VIAKKARHARQSLEMIGTGTFRRQQQENEIYGLFVD